MGSHWRSNSTGNKTINTGMIRVESGIPYTTVRGLMDRGHKVGFARGIYGGYQAILWDDISKVYHGASESEKTVKQLDIETQKLEKGN